jgi:hypothetical protein
VNQQSRIQTVARSVLERLATVGADPRNDEDTRSGKTLLVLISVLILPIAVLWGVLYLAFGALVGLVPILYFVILDEATNELQAAVAEVRDLARGLHPPILTELGLGPALEALAERTGVPVRVRAPDRRYPPVVGPRPISWPRRR